MTPHDLTAQLKAAVGPRLESVILFGSAAAGDHTGKRSDYNVLVVLDRLGPEELNALSKTARAWAKAGNPAPLLFTRDRLVRSADVFPLEITDIQGSHQVLYGTDAVRDLPVDQRQLRQQLEYELKGKLIQLRERYLLAAGKPREVTDLMINSLSTILVLFRGALRLYQPDAPTRKMDSLAALAVHVPFPTGPFETIAQLKAGRKVPGVRPDDLFADYLQAVETVVDAVDHFLHQKSEGRVP